MARSNIPRMSTSIYFANLALQALNPQELRRLTWLTIHTQATATLSTTMLLQLTSLNHLDLTGVIAGTEDTIDVLTTLRGLQTLRLCDPHTDLQISDSATAGTLVRVAALIKVSVRHCMLLFIRFMSSMMRVVSLGCLCSQQTPQGSKA